MKSILTLLALNVLNVNGLSPDGKCRILSLRGGGVHGSFEAGALMAIVDKMPAD